MNPISKIDITADMLLNGEIGIQNAGSTTGESYPAHVILPVMIYVG